MLSQLPNISKRFQSKFLFLRNKFKGVFEMKFSQRSKDSYFWCSTVIMSGFALGSVQRRKHPLAAKNARAAANKAELKGNWQEQGNAVLEQRK